MSTSINDSQNKSKIAIVIVGYNRRQSIARLLNSLLMANYPNYDIPLVISIDCSNDSELYHFVREFHWPFGNKFVIIHEKRLGLKDHIFSCGDMTQYFKGIILLEDDIYVSIDFYNYVCKTIEKYDHTNRVAGISLYSHEWNGYVNFPFQPLNDGSDVYAEQTVISWGECWTERMWLEFRDWLDNNQINLNALEMPESIKHWERAWSKYFYAFILSNDKYFIIPYNSLSTNFSEAGEHGETSDTSVQVNLSYGERKYVLKDFDDLVKYDVFSNNMSLFNSLGLKKDELCLDLYGNNQNTNHKRFWLSIQDLPFKCIRQFGLQLRPHELNVINNMEGNDIFLYDTSISSPFRGLKKYKLLRYHIRAFTFMDLTRYLFFEFIYRIKRKAHLS